MMDKFRLMQGDCLGRMQEIEDQSVDMVLCDLPYGFTDCRWDSIIDIEMSPEYFEVSSKRISEAYGKV